MADDQRMHGGDTPGLAGGRGHERHEEPVRLDDRPEPGAPADDGSADGPPVHHRPEETAR